MIRDTEKVHVTSPMGTGIQVIGSMTIEQVKAFLFGLMAVNTRCDVHKCHAITCYGNQYITKYRKDS
jgi:hypothetical protein